VLHLEIYHREVSMIKLGAVLPEVMATLEKFKDDDFQE